MAQNGKRALGRDAILQVDDLPREWVDTPEWGGEGAGVYVRTLTATERDAFEGSVQVMTKDPKGVWSSKPVTENMRAKLCALTIVDDNGERLFGDGDVKDLGRKSGAVLDRIFDKARLLSGFSQEDIEALEGNSESGPSDTSL